MSKMKPFANLIRSNLLRRIIEPNQSVFPSLILRTPRHYSNEIEPQKQNPFPDSFLHPPSGGAVYGRLGGAVRHALKTDIINLLDGSNLRTEDVKMEYTRNYYPVAVLVQFPSHSAFDSAYRAINRKGRLYKLDKATRSHWDFHPSYDRKVVLLQGIPHNALAEDVERFLSGCDYVGRIQFSQRLTSSEPIRLGLVHFPSQTQAMHAVLVKNRSFCLNNQILMRALE